MGWKKKLVRRYRKFVLGRFVQTIAAGDLRPFFVDDQGVWFPTKHGFSVLCNFEDRILELDVNPVWEAMETSFVLDNVRPGDVFIDVGAEHRVLLDAGGPETAREECSRSSRWGRTFDVLVRNIRHNGLDGVVEPVNLALGSRESTVRLVSTRGPKNHVEYALDDERQGSGKGRGEADHSRCVAPEPGRGRPGGFHQGRYRRL